MNSKTGQKKPLRLAALAMLAPLVLTACQTRIFSKCSDTPSPPVNLEADLQALEKTYCEGLKPEELGRYIWTDENGVAQTGIAPEDFFAAPSGVRSWMLQRFKQWEVMCEAPDVPASGT